MSTGLGLRERKKQQTRQKIVDTAIHLFAEHGFDRVSVAEVARQAEVSEATVFNYFTVKEALVYDGMEEFETALIEAIRQRPAEVSVLAAFGEYLLQPRGALIEGGSKAVAGIAIIARIVAGSTALRAREQQTFDRYTDDLAELIATETAAGPDDIEPWVVANALMGVNRALKNFVHAQALAGWSSDHIATELVVQGRLALERLERGLAEYPLQRVP